MKFLKELLNFRASSVALTSELRTKYICKLTHLKNINNQTNAKNQFKPNTSPQSPLQANNKKKLIISLKGTRKFQILIFFSISSSCSVSIAFNYHNINTAQK